MALEKRSRFSGKERDAESGLDYFGARYFSGAQGRFTSPDPVKVTPDRLRDPQQFNLYTYVRNNPMRFVDPTGEILTLSGDMDEAQKQVCQIFGGDCTRITYDKKTNTITVNIAGIDLANNEGVSLLVELISSSSRYDLALGATFLTAGGIRSLGESPVANLDRTPDQLRYRAGKSPLDLPGAGIDAQVAINPALARYRDSEGRPVFLQSLIFHELAEAYSKVDIGKPYSDFWPLIARGQALLIGVKEQGAHNAAVQRELKLRTQRPNLQLTGRAGDVLIREPKP